MYKFISILLTLAVSSHSFSSSMIDKDIIGIDDRSLVRINSGNSLHYALGMVGSYCTAVAIDEYHVLTAGHCVYEKSYDELVVTSYFRPFYKNHKSVYDWKNIYVLKGYLDGDKTSDLAVIRLKKKLLKNRYIKMLHQYENISGAVYGYPSDKEFRTLWKSRCDIYPLKSLLSYSCDTVSGMSGGAVVNKYGDLIGIHVLGRGDDNAGITLTRGLISEIKRVLKGSYRTRLWKKFDNQSDRLLDEYDKIYLVNNSFQKISVEMVFDNLNKEREFKRISLGTSDKVFAFKTIKSLFYLRSSKHKFSRSCDSRDEKKIEDKCFKQFRIKSANWQKHSFNVFDTLY